MTNSEALVKVKGYLTDYLPLDNMDEIDEIIKALQSGKKKYKKEARRWKRRYLDLRQRIFKLEEQTRWIPCSERLPKDYGEYICTMSDDNVQECGFVPDGTKGLISGWSTCEADGFKKLDYRDIKAWMPLPTSYQCE